MTQTRTRRPTRAAYVSLRRVRRSHKARIMALAATNGVSFKDQLMAMVWGVLKA